ncbi:MAG TPA: ABC transporter substrate binding protein [Myxococcota bacterium]|nr:ABC transporter substrate binding protein [Myxococcota bacterium]HRY94278.1 ABC transporter substrate binding protein [Myxococcota bacterium]HSA21401.1 ABC transporter substrate binding protein [Myxococcota bacterium]
MDEQRKPETRGPLPRDTLAPARRQQRAAWALAVALVAVLGGLYLWSQRMAPAAPPDAAPDGGPLPLPGYAPDGPTEPAGPEPVAFPGERCTPWHTSARQAPPSPGYRLLVLSSPLSDPEGFALSGLAAECGPNLSVRRLESLQPGELAALASGGSFRAVVALGSPAASAARAEAGGLPLLHALVPNPVGAGLDVEGAAGVSPWVPMAPLARHVDTLLPRSKPRLAVLFAEPLREAAGLAARALEARGRKVQLVPVADAAGLDGLLPGLRTQADAWLVLPDRQVIDQALYTRLQVAAEQAALPLCTSDEEHVRSGAFVGAGTDLHRIGAQLCRLAGALERGQLPPTARVSCPEYSFAAVNEMVVQKLGYLLDPGQLGQVKLIAWH